MSEKMQGEGVWQVKVWKICIQRNQDIALKVIVLIHYRLCFAVSMAIIDEIMQAHQT